MTNLTHGKKAYSKWKQGQVTQEEQRDSVQPGWNGARKATVLGVYVTG